MTTHHPRATVTEQQAASWMRGTGGNRFIGTNPTRAEFMRAVANGLDDLEDWCDGTDRRLDLSAITINTTRIPSGVVSISVTADLAECLPGDAEGGL